MVSLKMNLKYLITELRELDEDDKNSEYLYLFTFNLICNLLGWKKQNLKCP